MRTSWPTVRSYSKHFGITTKGKHTFIFWPFEALFVNRGVLRGQCVSAVTCSFRGQDFGRRFTERHSFWAKSWSSKTLDSDFPRDSHLVSVWSKGKIWSDPISWHRAEKRRELRGRDLTKLTILTTWTNTDWSGTGNISATIASQW
jgi:hypothetical protein